MPNRIFLFLAVVVAVAVVTWSQTTKAQTRKPRQPRVAGTKVSALMRLKLERSKGILEGLSLEDHSLIAGNARQLKLLSMESGWNTIQTKEYAEQSRDFRRACDSIVEAAEQQDLGRATVGYFSLCTRCVECHRYIRGQATDAK